MKSLTSWRGAAALLALGMAAAGVQAEPGWGGGGQMEGHGGAHMMGGWGGGEGGGHMMGPGMGMGMMGSHGLGPVWSLNLTDDQRKKVRAVNGDLRKKQAALREQIEDESDKLWDLYGAERRDPSAIGKVYSKLFDVQRQMIEEQLTARNKVEDVLTKEQRQQLRQLSMQWRWNNRN